MKKLILVVCCLFFVSCAASNEVKQASSQVEVALASLREAQDDLRNFYLRELEETRQLVGRAIVADAVVRKVNTLSKEELKGDLISISKAAKSQRDAYQGLVNEIMQTKPKKDEKAEDLVKAIFDRRVKALRSLATTFKAGGNTASAIKLIERAEELETASKDEKDFGDMVVIIQLEQSQADVRKGMKDLDDYLQFLQMIHSQVNEWITTDVTVKGEDVAALIEKHAAVLGMKGSQGGEQ
jgi:hypothetical protein